MRYLATGALLFALSGLVSCRILPGNKSEPNLLSPTVSSGKFPIGVIELVDGGGGFVLIKSSRMVAIDPESILDVVGDGGLVIAQVKLSPARKGQFLTADIVSGMPVKGQTVLSIYQTASPADSAQKSSGHPGTGDEIQVLE